MVGKMTEKEQITVTSAENGIRIDRLLADRFPELTRSYIQKMIRDGDVLANEKLIRIAKEWGVETEGRDIYDLAHEMSELALSRKIFRSIFFTRMRICLWSISQRGWSFIRQQDIIAVRSSMRFCIIAVILYPESMVYCVPESYIALIRIRPDL